MYCDACADALLLVMLLIIYCAVKQEVLFLNPFTFADVHVVHPWYFSPSHLFRLLQSWGAPLWSNAERRVQAAGTGGEQTLYA